MSSFGRVPFRATEGDLSVLRKAVARFSHAVELLPDRPDTYWHRARGLLLLGEVEAGVADLERVRELDPGIVPAYFLLAAVHERRGESDRAHALVAAAEKVAETGWARPWLVAQRAFASAQYPESQAALQLCVDWLKEEDHREPYLGWALEMRMGLALAQLAGSDRIGAAESLAILRESWPQAVEAHLFSGSAHAGLERFDGVAGGFERAERFFEHAFKLSREIEPGSGFVATVAAKVNFSRSPESASRWIARIHSAARGEALRAFQLFFFSRDVDGALAHQLFARELDPSDPAQWFTHAQFFCNEERWEEALEPIRKGLELRGDHRLADAWQANLALGLVKTGDVERGLEMAERIYQRGRDALSFSRLGQLYAARRDTAKTLAAYKKALDFDRASDTLCNMAECLLRLDELDRAVEIAGEAVERYPQSSRTHELLGRVHRHRGEWDEAITAYQAACSAVPASLESHLRLGELLDREKNDPFAAFKIYSKAPRVRPGNGDARQALVDLLRREPEALRLPARSLLRTLQARIMEEPDATTRADLGATRAIIRESFE